jgi:hypothetical protein
VQVPDPRPVSLIITAVTFGMPKPEPLRAIQRRCQNLRIIQSKNFSIEPRIRPSSKPGNSSAFAPGCRKESKRDEDCGSTANGARNRTDPGRTSPGTNVVIVSGCGAPGPMMAVSDAATGTVYNPPLSAASGLALPLLISCRATSGRFYLPYRLRTISEASAASPVTSARSAASSMQATEYCPARRMISRQEAVLILAGPTPAA